MVYSINSLVSVSSVRGKETVAEETNGNIDLNLSLSLNGRFGVDPHRNHTVIGSSSHSQVLIPHDKRSSVIFDESGGELRMWPSLSTGTEVKQMEMGRKELQLLALMDANKRRSLDSGGSSTISFVPNQTIEGRGFPANIECSAAKNRGKSVKIMAEKILSKAIPAKDGKGREFERLEDMPNVFTTISGRKVEGYLSKFGEEEICIFCACHAYSLSPAEFIIHAGGGDVAIPERCITVKLPVGDSQVVILN